MVRLTHRAGRRVIAAASIACAAALLPAVALAATGSHQHATPAASQCRAANTTVWLGLNPDGATAGTTYYPIEFTNTGHHACWMYGYPGVSAITASGHRTGPAASHAGTRHTVTLRAGGTAHVLLGIVQRGFISGCHAGKGDGIEVYAPGQTSRQPIDDFGFPVCANKVFMHVGPVRAGLMIP